LPLQGLPCLYPQRELRDSQPGNGRAFRAGSAGQWRASGVGRLGQAAAVMDLRRGCNDGS